MDNLIDIIDNPIVIWEYKDKRFYCKNCNDIFLKEFNVNNIVNVKSKHILKYFSKKYHKCYKECLKTKNTQTYEIYYDGKKISSTIIYLDNNIILEKFDIIKLENNDILKDPFNMIIIVYNRNQIYSTNFLFLRNTEYNKNEIINKNINELFTYNINFNKYNYISNNNIILKNGKLLNVDLYLIKLNGIYDIMIIKDISTIRENLINNKIFKNIDHSIIVFDKDSEHFETYKCIDSNNLFNKLFVNGNKIINKNIIEIFDENIYFKIKKAYAEMISNNSYILQNIKYNNKFYDFNCFIIEDHIFGIIIIDITNSVEIQSLKLAKENFLEGIIDKLRRPINGITNILTLFSETKLDIEQKEYINNTLEYSYLLSTLMSDFTDYANLKLNKLIIEKEPFNLREELDQYYEGILLKSREKNIDIIFDIDSNVPPYIITDRYRFKQILFNIISNSIKFTDKGRVSLKIYTESFEENKYNLHIVISDTGIGIENDKLEKIFDSFYQVGNINLTHKGSGLGLSLCKGLCELMGGKIWVTSKLNNGSTFYITLPIEEFTNIQEIEDKSVQILKNKNILIIDENSLNRITISKILLEWNMKPLMGPSAEDAIFLVNNNHFDLCLIDIDASRTLVSELVNKIKEINKFIPIIAMSSFDNRNYDKNIFNYLIIKPVNKSKLLKLFINIFSDIEIHSKKYSTEDIQIYNNLSILLHLEQNENIIVKSLQKIGYTNINIFNNQNIEDLMKYSLLLLDLENNDTLSIIKKINKTNKERPYIIILISQHNKKIKKKIEKYKIDAYILKPVDKNELKAILKVISRRFI